jgi:hypothetical protein
VTWAVIAGPEHGLQRLIVQVQPVAPDEVGRIHRHDSPDQILCVLQGEVLIEVDGQPMVCRPGEASRRSRRSTPARGKADAVSLARRGAGYPLPIGKASLPQTLPSSRTHS